MERTTKRLTLGEAWDRLVLLLIAELREGWESEFNEIPRREVQRLAVVSDDQGRDE